MTARSWGENKGPRCIYEKATRGHPLSIFDQIGNKRISSKHFPVEGCFNVMRIFLNSGYVIVTLLKE
jgi:hypothetical protein